jgi:hypothetical protein
MSLEKKFFQKGATRVERIVERYERTIWKNRSLRREFARAHRLAVPRPEPNERIIKKRGHYELMDIPT